MTTPHSTSTSTGTGSNTSTCDYGPPKSKLEHMWQGKRKGSITELPAVGIPSPPHTTSPSRILTHSHGMSHRYGTCCLVMSSSNVQHADRQHPALEHRCSTPKPCHILHSYCGTEPNTPAHIPSRAAKLPHATSSRWLLILAFICIFICICMEQQGDRFPREALQRQSTSKI